MRGKIVLLPFPFDDLSATKVRPAVCLTDAVGAHRHVVVAFITSQTLAPPLESDVLLNPARPDFTSTGLRVSSAVRLHRLLTVTTSLIQRELGELSPALLAEVGAKLRKLFQL
ncbi:MAG: type II toxin-antitoxin system PemK/MazF family toxin [Verrucomicrobia bacterium]|nr:type II toxin-antitoxin system PemK/MazF family toxin [Verrucomicrobiota bacterium]